MVTDSCTDSNRIPSTTGALKCVDLSEYRNDSLVWRVNLLQPFEIDKELLDSFKPEGSRTYLYVLDNWIYDQDSVLFGFNSIDTLLATDSVKPGNYHVLIFSQKYYKPKSYETTVYNGDTLIVGRIDDYKFQTFYKPILVSNVRISTDSISQINVDFFLEVKRRYMGDMWDRMEPKFDEIVYSEWDGTIFSK